MSKVVKKLVPLAVLALVLALVGVAWMYRHQVMIWIKPPASAAHPSENPDVLYSWVDDNGVTHFSQEPVKNARRVEYNGATITPMKPVDPLTAARLEAAMKKEAEQGKAQQARPSLVDALHEGAASVGE